MNDQRGFTLIELLVATGIIGILAAIAIPFYAEYRAAGFDARARNDLRTVAMAEEAYFVDSEVYKSCTEADCSTILPGIGLMSNGVTLRISATPTGFTGSSTHPQGTGMVCNWDKEAGGLTGCF